jgi:hypothetical protein
VNSKLIARGYNADAITLQKNDTDKKNTYAYVANTFEFVSFLSTSDAHVAHIPTRRNIFFKIASEKIK